MSGINAGAAAAPAGEPVASACSLLCAAAASRWMMCCSASSSFWLVRIWSSGTWQHEMTRIAWTANGQDLVKRHLTAENDKNCRTANMLRQSGQAAPVSTNDKNCRTPELLKRCNKVQLLLAGQDLVKRHLAARRQTAQQTYRQHDKQQLCLLYANGESAEREHSCVCKHDHR
jgi:hypothetical protein